MAALQMILTPRFLAALLLLFSAPANAIVGGAVPSVGDIGWSVVTIVGSRGNFCTGTLIGCLSSP